MTPFTTMPTKRKEPPLSRSTHLEWTQRRHEIVPFPRAAEATAQASTITYAHEGRQNASNSQPHQPVHERTSNLFTSTNQKRRHRWYHRVAFFASEGSKRKGLLQLPR